LTQAAGGPAKRFFQAAPALFFLRQLAIYFKVSAGATV
jgi:hypothetical protein